MKTWIVYYDDHLFGPLGKEIIKPTPIGKLRETENGMMLDIKDCVCGTYYLKEDVQ